MEATGLEWLRRQRGLKLYLCSASRHPAATREKNVLEEWCKGDCRVTY